MHQIIVQFLQTVQASLLASSETPSQRDAAFMFTKITFSDKF